MSEWCSEGTPFLELLSWTAPAQLLVVRSLVVGAQEKKTKYFDSFVAQWIHICCVKYMPWKRESPNTRYGSESQLKKKSELTSWSNQSPSEYGSAAQPEYYWYAENELAQVPLSSIFNFFQEAGPSSGKEAERRKRRSTSQQPDGSSSSDGSGDEEKKKPGKTPKKKRLCRKTQDRTPTIELVNNMSSL